MKLNYNKTSTYLIFHPPRILFIVELNSSSQISGKYDNFNPNYLCIPQPMVSHILQNHFFTHSLNLDPPKVCWMGFTNLYNKYLVPFCPFQHSLMLIGCYDCLFLLLMAHRTKTACSLSRLHLNRRMNRIFLSKQSTRQQDWSIVFFNFLF
jgi:hypothetical protein